MTSYKTFYTITNGYTIKGKQNFIWKSEYLKKYFLANIQQNMQNITILRDTTINKQTFFFIQKYFTLELKGNTCI